MAGQNVSYLQSPAQGNHESPFPASGLHDNSQQSNQNNNNKNQSNNNLEDAINFLTNNPERINDKIKLHPILQKSLKAISTSLEKRVKCFKQIQKYEAAKSVADAQAMKEGLLNKYPYWDKFNPIKFQIPHPAQQKQLNSELLEIQFGFNLNNLTIVIKHLELAIDLHNKDIEFMIKDAKDNVEKLYEIHRESVQPPSLSNLLTRLNLDVNKLLPVDGKTFLEKKNNNDYGVFHCANQICLFYIAIDNFHHKLLERNPDLHYKDRINNAFFNDDSHKSSKNQTKPQKYNKKNKKQKHQHLRKPRKNNKKTNHNQRTKRNKKQHHHHYASKYNKHYKQTRTHHHGNQFQQQRKNKPRPNYRTKQPKNKMAQIHSQLAPSYCISDKEDKKNDDDNDAEMQ